MKAFFLLSCLLLFMALGAGQNSTTSQDSSTTAPSTTTSQTPGSATAPSTTTSQTPGSATAPSTATSQTPGSATAPSTATSKTPGSATDPSTATSQTPGSATDPSPATSQTPGSATDPSPATSQTPGSATASPTIEQTPGSPTTSLPESNSTQAVGQTTTPVPALNETCALKKCNDSSTCIALNTASFCQCPEGYYYNNSKCRQGRTFPGIIKMSWDLSDLDNKTSLNYQKLYFKVQHLFESAFVNDTTFGQTVILSLQTFATSRSDIRSMGQVEVTVENIFDRNSEITLDVVNKAIQTQMNKEQNVIYEQENLCDFYGCSGTDVNCSEPLHCSCQEGLERTPSSSICSVCSLACNEKHNKQCIKRPSSQAPQCACLPGYTKMEGNCRKCDFGYNGVDCKDNYMLIFTVVCVIGGAILLGTIIGLIVLSSSNKRKKSTEEDSLISRDFSNMKLETTGFNNPASSTGSLFPKVNTVQFPRVQSNVKSNPYEDIYSPRSVPTRDY